MAVQPKIDSHGKCPVSTSFFGIGGAMRGDDVTGTKERCLLLADGKQSLGCEGDPEPSREFPAFAMVAASRFTTAGDQPRAQATTTTLRKSEDVMMHKRMARGTVRSNDGLDVRCASAALSFGLLPSAAMVSRCGHSPRIATQPRHRTS